MLYLFIYLLSKKSLSYLDVAVANFYVPHHVFGLWVDWTVIDACDCPEPCKFSGHQKATSVYPIESVELYILQICGFKTPWSLGSSSPMQWTI